MSIIVHKYGGSSLADAEKIRNVARRIIRAKEEGNQVVAVCSAMGDTTDDLLKLAHQISDSPEERELDVLLSTGELVTCTLMAMALRSLGHHAVSLSGAQAGIRTDKSYSKARIVRVDAGRMQRELDLGHIVIVAGFQGETEDEDVTTLGRGGSNTTAVAVAAALGASVCAMYTDVDGVYTADPRIVPEARKLPEIGYEEMLELATYGSNVLHNRSVELAELYNVPILVASSFKEVPGTLIHGGIPMEVRNKVRGIAQDSNVAKITIVGIPDKPGTAAAIFEPLAKSNVSVDTIVQNISLHQKLTDLTFTVAKTDLKKAMGIVQPVAKSIGAKECISADGLAKVSVVGTGMQNTPGFAARMFRALSDQGINIELITTAEIRITCIIAADKAVEAVRALHRAFELEKS
jgi:aspartate kinase